MTNPSKFTYFLRKVRNQVNKNRENEHKPKYYIFEDINRYDDTFQNVFFKNRFEKDKNSKHMNYCGPEDYPWENDTKCYFFDSANRDYRMLIFAIPHNWLLKYDPTIPIFIDTICSSYTYAHYLDLEKRKWILLVVYLIGDRFRFYEDPGKIIPEDPKPYSIGKGDEDWCMTYSNIQLSRMRGPNSRSYFRSFLLIKNIDFSEFDARVKAEGLKCPVSYKGSTKLKDGPNLTILSCYYYSGEKSPCICVNCRKDYRAVEVGVILHLNRAHLYLRYRIK